MGVQGECRHNWVKHGERSFYCESCGYFVETLEEFQALLSSEKRAFLKEVESIADAINCPHCKERLKQELQKLKPAK